jgi:hypothetical protein
MNILTEHTDPRNTDRLKDLIRKRWPGTLPESGREKQIFSTGLTELDALFPLGGIPYGQLVEITGGTASGKTSLLFKLLSHFSRKHTIAYIDFGNTFFPSAAVTAGIDLVNLLLIKPLRSGEFIKLGVRTAELLLRDKAAACVVFDLVNERQPLPITLLHRLRLKTVRAGALALFLTENNSDIIPASMASLRLQVARTDSHRVTIRVAKSRLCKENTRVAVSL